MRSAEVPPDEVERLVALRALAVLDTPPDPVFDRLARLASVALEAPIALVTLIDEDRQWFKARVGVDLEGADREVAFCAHTIVDQHDGPFEVPDTAADERFHDNPFVVGEPYVRFYAGQPLRAPGGQRVGTLCVMDRVPRTLTDQQRTVLVELAALVEDQLAQPSMGSLVDELEERIGQKAFIFDTMQEGLLLHDEDGRIVEWNPATESILGLSADVLAGRERPGPRWSVRHPDGTPWLDDELPAIEVLRTGVPVRGALVQITRPDGTGGWLRISSVPGHRADGSRFSVTTFADVSAELAGARALEQSEELRRATLDALDHGVLLLDLQGQVLLANPAAERIVGWGAEELTDRWRSGQWIPHRESGEPVEVEDRPLVRALATGEAVLDELMSWHRADGERVIVRASVIPLDAGSTDPLLIVTFADVTAERTAQHLLDATWRAAPVGLAVLDERGAVLQANEAFSTHVGLTVDAVVGRPAVGFLHPDDAELARADYAAAFRSGRPTPSRDQRVLLDDGTVRWISATACPISQGDRRLFVVATVDMTERRRLESDLRRFHLLFQHANDIITVLAGDGTPLYASPSSERLLGFPEGYQPAAGILGIVHPDDLPAAAEELRALIDGTRVEEPFVVRVIDARGDVKHLECVGVNLLDEPDVAGVVITSRDVSERQRLSELLAHRATHDDLTGLANRTLFVERLAAALARSDRDGHRVAVCFLDLDDFKEINDRLGHAAGDELLVDVADRLATHARAGDEVARIGGDEFLVLFDPVADQAHALEAATRLVEVVTGEHVITAGRVRSGATAGVAVARPGEGAAALMGRADGALYRAKSAGKARAVLDES